VYNGISVSHASMLLPACLGDPFGLACLIPHVFRGISRRRHHSKVIRCLPAGHLVLFAEPLLV
jgi:hypothetical protein